MAAQANRVLICDTDLITTSLWSEFLFGDCPSWIADEADRRTYDLYLLTDVDESPAPDHRYYMPGDRQAQFDMFRRAIERRGRPYLHLRGGWNARFETARAAIARLIAPRR